MRLNFFELNRANGRRQASSFPQCEMWSEISWSNALAGEVGELCNLTKKRQRGDIVHEDELGKEIADIVIYADLLASSMGFELEDLIRQKFNEVSERVGSEERL